ncbi:MAG: metallophosphoesterase family protein [Pseudomonadota bacterium]
MRHLPLALFASILLVACHPDSLSPAPGAVVDVPATPPSTPPSSPSVTPPPVLTGFLINPYLQNPTPSSMVVMFEPSAPTTVATVEYRKLGDTAWQSTTATIETVQQNTSATITTEAAPYTARLTGLPSNTTHEYRVVTDAGTTPLLRFKTWPAAGDSVEAARFMVISDTQGNNPDWLKRVTNEGLIARDCDGDVNLCVERIHGVIIPGDIVNDGEDIEQWRKEFFGSGEALWRYLPIIPAIGNHDYDLKHYLIYFDLPDSGSPANQEEWYRKDFMNLRLLTMQTNLNAGAANALTEQTAWMQNEITQATSDAVDYLFAQWHAPCKSEFWIPGESEQACVYVDFLEQFSTDTGAISGHFFGHTHAYSRGQSRDVSHLWFNGASGSGNIDNWGEFEQADYDEFESSWDEYGYSIVEFATTGTPRVRSVRRSGGSDGIDYSDGFSDETKRDNFIIGGDNTAPAAPVPLTPTGTVNTAEVMLHASFHDADSDPLHEAQWQLRQMLGTYDAPLLDVWGNETRAHNTWFRRNLNSGIDVDYWRMPYLAVGSYCWRVRYRDAKLAWSSYSPETCFEVSGTTEGANLVTNGGAESGVAGWTVTEGALQAIPSLGCSSAQENLGVFSGAQTFAVTAPQGAFFFSVGGCSGEVAERAKAVQTVDVSASAAAIDAGQALGVLRASLRTFSKWDVPTVRFRALDASGRVLAPSKPLLNQTGAWIEQASSLLLPTGTRTVEIELGGVKQDGVVNDSFVDNVRFHVVTQPGARQTLAKQPILSPGNGMALIPKMPDLAAFEATTAGTRSKSSSINLAPFPYTAACLAEPDEGREAMPGFVCLQQAPLKGLSRTSKADQRPRT